MIRASSTRGWIIIFLKVKKIVGVNSISFLYIPVWEGCVSPLEHSTSSWKTVKEKKWRGWNGEHGKWEKHPKAKRKQQKRDSFYKPDVFISLCSFPHHHTVPSYRSRRRGPDCTRLCSSAPWKHGRSRSWSEGNLAPAEMKGQYYYKKPAGAASYGTEIRECISSSVVKLRVTSLSLLSSLFIALIP